MTRRVHGAHRLLEQIGPEMLVLVDAGITSGGFEHQFLDCVDLLDPLALELPVGGP